MPGARFAAQARMRWSALVLVVLASCAPAHLTVRPQASVLVAEKDLIGTRARAPESGAGGLDVTLSSAGAFRHKDEESVWLLVDVAIENRSESVTAGFDPRTAILTADSGRKLQATNLPSVAASDTTLVPIEPGAKRSFHLEFLAPWTDDPRDLVPFALRLDVSYGKSDFPLVVTFVRNEPYGYYYAPWPPPYYYYGPYWGWGWGRHW